ncbi:MAG: tryptophan-rich sensory protein [Bacilli bacterium]|nr:tryptophan-rich sensory protein [Bacilli bacterium]
MRKVNYKELLLYALFPLVLGIIVGLLTDTSTYSGSIPAIVFPIVWSILYVLMGISSYLVRDKKELMIIYIINLIVNYAWSFIFFNLEFRVFAFFWILLLLGITIYMAYKFYKENKLAGYLLIPYILWLVFAAFLNLSIIT